MYFGLLHEFRVTIVSQCIFAGSRCDGIASRNRVNSISREGDCDFIATICSCRICVTLNDDGDVRLELGAWDTFSIPAQTVRAFENTGDTVVEALVIVSGDHQKRPRFASHVLEKAFAEGVALDAQGYVAAAHLIPNYGMVAE